jgi:hypothetical protein
MVNDNFLYFAQSAVETGEDGTSEAIMVPASKFIGADAISATATTFTFKHAYGKAGATHVIRINHGSGKNKEVIKAFMNAMNANPQKGGFVVMTDFETGSAKSENINPIFKGLGVVDGAGFEVVTETGSSGVIRGTASGTTLSTSYGLGAHSTGTGAAGRPQYARTEVGGIIVTTIKVDLMGLKAKGGDAGDAIGVGTNPAYIYKNVVAENGIIFKQEIACLELPAAASGTITTDINLAWNSAATIDYDEAVGTGSEINTGGLVAGQVVSDETAALTADHYAYLTEGDTAASDGVYSTGQILITLYGAKLATA